MTQTAMVKRLVSSRKAEIVVRRESACGHHCATCEGCKMYDQPTVTVTAENEAGAMPGDTVTVETSSAHVLGMAAVVYLLPFVLFFTLHLAAGALSFSTPVSVTLGVVGFAAGAAADLLLDRRVKRKQALSFRIVSVERR